MTGRTDLAGAEIIPELVLADPAAGRALLAQVFGFRPGPDGLLVLGDQRIAVTPGQSQGHGPLHHVALGVADAHAALAQALDRGGRLDAAETPQGPVLIPEFWDAGAEYVFVEGPEGARIELCARPGARRAGPPGHDHLGIACRDLGGMRRFFLHLGLAEVAAPVLHRAGGDIAVCFLTTGRATVELYAPPVPPEAGPAPFWRRLMVPGLATAITGPEGLVLTA